MAYGGSKAAQVYPRIGSVRSASEYDNDGRFAGYGFDAATGMYNVRSHQNADENHGVNFRGRR
jgi:hypothetical protein